MLMELNNQNTYATVDESIAMCLEALKVTEEIFVWSYFFVQRYLHYFKDIFEIPLYCPLFEHGTKNLNIHPGREWINIS